MVILTTIRQSPAYLYVKTYCLCALVTLFTATPVSSRLPRVGETLQLNKYRIISTRLGPRIVPVDEGGHASALPGLSPRRPRAEAKAKRKIKAKAAAGENEDDPPQLVVTPELIAPWARDSRLRQILARWYRRAVDLSQVKRLLARDDGDVRAYPELEWDATVRRSSALHVEERRFIELRRHRISSRGGDSLHTLLSLPATEKVHPDDVPLIALGGSGGGYRAMYGFTAFIAAAKRLGLWDCITWVAGVSGTCWTLAAYYTIARQDVARLTRHYLSVAGELAHPMSVTALDTVARSSRGVYFLIGPLVRKARNSIIGLSVMDLYATLTTTYQFISRERPSARLSRASFQFSKVWARSGIDRGLEPMPFLTAVRRAPSNSSGVRPHTDSSISKGRPPERALAQHHTPVTDSLMNIKGVRKKLPRAESMTVPGFFQWFEISPLEIGSPDAGGYIPTWAWGRTFAAGQSVGRAPEQSLSLMLGQCTSAPAGPLTGYIDALLASMPKGTLMSRLLMVFNDLIRSKKLARLWGNPIRAGHDPNPFYGLNIGSSRGASHVQAEPIGVGVGSLDSARLENLGKFQGVDGSKSEAALDRLARRVLSKQELVELNNLVSSLETVDDKRTAMRSYLSTVWSLKVATYRALRSQYQLSWGDVIVTSASSSLPAQVGRPTESDVLRISLSSDWHAENGNHCVPILRPTILHNGSTVVATVIAEQGPVVPPLDQSEPLQSDQARDPSATATADASITSSERQPPWESQGRVRLMDSGMSNNLPNHILSRPERAADILLAFDSSSDVQLGSAVRRLQNFADDCGLGELEEQTGLFGLPEPRYSSNNSPGAGEDGLSEAAEIEEQFLDQYARVFRGSRETGEEVFVVYCPLLPNGANPGFNPSTASFSNSFNLVWTPSQIKTLFATSEANLCTYAIGTIRRVARKVYLDKKARRLALS